MNKQLFLWDHGKEDKNLYPGTVSLQSLLGLVQFDAGNLGPSRKTSSFKINVELGSKC